MNIAGATGTSLTLTGVQQADEGTYHVVVRNEAGSTVSSDVRFYLVTAPAIVSQSQPTDLVVHYQSTLTFSAEATAPGETNGFPVGNQWQLNGTNISGATTNSYAFCATAGSEGTYAVVVTNAAGSASTAWQLGVLYDTLAYHLSTNAVAYSGGRTDILDATVVIADCAYDFYDGTHMALTNAAWSTNCWLYGVRGLTGSLVAWTNRPAGGYGATLVPCNILHFVC